MTKSKRAAPFQLIGKIFREFGIWTGILRRFPGKLLDRHCQKIILVTGESDKFLNTVGISIQFII